MGNWDYKPVAVVDFDDMEDRYDRNGMNFLFWWKSQFPNFKVTMFAIPGRCSPAFLSLLASHKDWIQLGVHGWRHDDNFEATKWDSYTANALFDRIDRMQAFAKVFRAPGWQITYPQPYNESPDPTKPVNSDPHLIYNILKERGYIVADQHYNKERRPEGLQVYCSCHPLFLHGHVEDINVGDPAGRNGMRQLEEEHGVPWDKNTEFKFITELSEEERRCV